MTLLRQTSAEIASKNTDQNGRLKTNESNLMFEANFSYSAQSRLFGNVLTSGATVDHVPFLCGLNLNVPATNGAAVRRLSYRYFSQLGGRVLTFSSAFRFPTAKTGIIARYGMYDDGDGVFLEVNGSTAFICIRSSVSGSVVETRIAQQNWNQDTLDGNGPSRVLLNKEAIQSLNIRFSNTGIGNVQVAFLINGERIVAHMFSQTNVGSVPLLRPVSLPIQAELRNQSGAAGSNSTFFIGNVVMVVDGPYDIRGNSYAYCCDTGTSAVPVSTSSWTPVASIRMAELKNNIKFRGNFLLDNINILLVGNGNVQWRAMVNAELFGSVSWQNPSETVGSALQRDLGATSMNHGTCILSGYSNTGSSNAKSGSENIIGRDRPVLHGKAIGANDTLTLAMRAMASGMSAFATINYVETED